MTSRPPVHATAVQWLPYGSRWEPNAVVSVGTWCLDLRLVTAGDYRGDAGRHGVAADLRDLGQAGDDVREAGLARGRGDADGLDCGAVLVDGEDVTVREDAE